MDVLLEKEVTDLSNEDFNKKYWKLDEEMRKSLLWELNKIRLEKNNEFSIKEVFDHETFLENAIVLKEVVELLQKYKIRYEEKQPFLWDFFELLLTTWLKQEAWQFFTPVPIAKFICKSIPIKNIIDKKLKEWQVNDLLPTIIDYAAWSWHFLTESMEEIQSILRKIPKEKLKPVVAKKIKAWEWNFDWAYDYMYWVEKDYRLVKTAKVWCFLHWDWIANVIHWDWLDSFWKSKKYRWKLKINWHDSKKDKDNWNFDLVLSNPPYSVDYFKNDLKKEYAENDFELFSKLTEASSEIEALFIERTSQLLKEGW
jgi:type I restriction enzyme M protein